MATWEELNKAYKPEDKEKEAPKVKVASNSSWDDLNSWAANEPKAVVQTQVKPDVTPVEEEKKDKNIFQKYSEATQEVVAVSAGAGTVGAARVLGGLPELTLKVVEPANVIAARLGQGLYKGLGLVLPDKGKLSEMGDDFYSEMRSGYNKIQEASFDINVQLAKESEEVKETLVKDTSYAKYKEETAGVEDLSLTDLKDPKFWLYEVYGSTVENAPLMYATFGVGKAAAASSAGAGVYAWLAGAGGATTFSLGMNASVESQSAYTAAISSGKSREDALVEAERVFNRNAAGNSLLETAQMILLYSPLGSKLKATSPLWKAAINAAKIGGAGLMEVFQERGEDAIQEMADKEDFDYAALGSKLTQTNITKTDFISFVLGAGMQGVGNVFVEGKNVEEEVKGQVDEIASNMWDGEGNPPTGGAAETYLAKQIKENPDDVQTAYDKVVGTRKTFVEDVKKVASTENKSLNEEVVSAAPITDNTGAELGKVEIKQSGDQFVSKFTADIGEAGAQVDFDYSKTYATPAEAQQAATDSLIVWAEQERTNANLSPEAQTRLEDLITKARKPEVEKVPEVKKEGDKIVPPLDVPIVETAAPVALQDLPKDIQVKAFDKFIESGSKDTFEGFLKDFATDTFNPKTGEVIEVGGTEKIKEEKKPAKPPVDTKKPTKPETKPKKKAFKEGDRVFLKNQKSKREGVIELFTKDPEDGDIATIALDNGQQKTIRVRNIGHVVDKAPTQKEQVKEVVEEKGEVDIKEISSITGILEPNVRRIVGMGAKDGTFERVDKGVYSLNKEGQEIAVVKIADAIESLPKLAKQGFKADMIFLDIPYETKAVKGGSRGVNYDFVSVEDFEKVVEATKIIARDENTPVIHMYSQAVSGLKEMQAYNDVFPAKGFVPVGKGEWQKTYKNGKPVAFPTRKGSMVTKPEGIIVFTQSGKTDKQLESLQFKTVRPRGYQTEKAEEMLKAMIEMTTEEGDVVFDPFAGSGSTGAAAVKAGRKTVAIEKDEKVAKEITQPRIEKAAKETEVVSSKKEPTEKKEDAPVLKSPAKIADIPRDIANQAHDGTSFDPEKRGAYEQVRYTEAVEAFAAEIEPLAESEAQQKIAQDAVDAYAEGYKKKTLAWLTARGRLLSPMITGAANFPVARNRKRLDVEQKRSSEMFEYTDKFLRGTKKKLAAQSVEDRGGSAVVAQTELANLKESLTSMKAANKILKDKKLNDEQKVAELTKLPSIKESTARELLTPDFAGRKGFASFSLTSVRGKIKRLEQAAARKDKMQGQENRVLLEGEGFIIEEHPQDERIRILYEEKPDKETTQKLRKNGWKYSPLNKAWQRKNTRNGLVNVRQLFAEEVAREKTVQNEIEQKEVVSQSEKLRLVTVEKKDQKTTRAKIGSLDVMIKETEKGKFERPTTKVKKKEFADFVEVEGEMIFQVKTEGGIMYLYRKTDTGETKLRPSALGLIEENLEEGQVIEFNIEDIKQTGTLYNLENATGDTVAYEGVPSAATLKKTNGKLPLKNPRTGKLVGSLSPDEWFTLPANKVVPDSDMMKDAIADLRRGERSFSGLPILVTENEEGTYDIIDGHHRYGQQIFGDETNQLVVMTDEKKYKELSDKETAQTEAKESYSNGGNNASVAFDIPVVDDKGTPDPRFDLGAAPLPSKMAGLDEINTIELPELVDIVRELSGKVPEIKKAFRKAGKGGDFNALYNRIRLNAKLFQKGHLHDATKVLAHELGHMTDSVPDSVKLNRGNLIGRLLTLREFMGSTFNPETGEKVTVEQRREVKTNTIKEVQKEFGYKTQKETLADPKAKKEIKTRYKDTMKAVLAKDGFIQDSVLREELLAATRFWTPYNPKMVPESYRAYRESSVELYAEALSMLYVSPRNLARIAPTFYKQFFAHLDKKPTVRDAYFEVQDLLAGDREAVTKRRRAGVKQMFKEGDLKAADVHNKKLADKEVRSNSLWARFKHEAIDKNYQIIDRVKETEKKTGKKLNPDDNPVFYLEERNYVGGKVKAVFDKEINPIYKTLTENEISWEDMGEVLLYERITSGDRSNFANPRGITPDAAAELLLDMKEELGVERWNLLHGQLTNFRAAANRITELAYKAGLYKEELYLAMKKNPSYATFQVLDFLEQGMTSRVFQSVGTFKDVTNPANATLLKMSKTLVDAERNVSTQKTIDFLQEYHPQDIKEAEYSSSPKGRIPLKPRQGVKELKLVTVFDQGKLKGYYVDPYIADTINNQSHAMNNMIIHSLRFFNGKLFRPLFIIYNSGFQAFNLIRDFTRFYKNIPTMTLGRAFKRYYQARTIAKYRAFGLPKKPTDAELKTISLFEKMEEEGMLSLTFNDISKGMRPEDKQIDKILADSGIEEFQPVASIDNLPRFAQPAGRALEKVGVIKAAKSILDFIEKTGNYIETLPKAAGVYEYRGTEGEFLTKDQKSFIRRKIGSPDFLAGGTYKPATNEIFLFSNAITQGIRSDIEVMTDPTTRSGYWWKTAKITILPKILMYGALMGLFGDDTEDMMKSASEYDRTNYTIIPLGVDENGKTVYFRMPQDETGRFIGAMFWKVLTAPTNQQTIGADIMQIISYTGGQIPSVTPVVSSLAATTQYMSGNNPYDAFRGRYVLSDTVFAAGGWQSHKAFLGWQFNQLGGGIFYKFYHEPTAPQEKSGIEKIFNYPIVGNVAGRFVRVSDYGKIETLREIRDKVKQEEAQVSVDKKNLVNEYVGRAHEEGLTQKLADEMVVEYFEGDVTKENYSEAIRLQKRLQLQVIRGGSEPEVVAVIDSNTNAQKAAILQEIGKSKSAEEYEKLLNDLYTAGIISTGTLEKLSEL